MRIDPAEEITSRKEIEERRKLRTHKITHVVALIVAFISTFFFIIKILFL
jgi:hypothetical protein